MDHLTNMNKHFDISLVTEDVNVDLQELYETSLKIRYYMSFLAWGNKCRIDNYFKTLGTESYLKCILAKRHNSALAEFRCGVAPLRLEIKQYNRVKD